MGFGSEHISLGVLSMKKSNYWSYKDCSFFREATKQMVLNFFENSLMGTLVG